MKLSYDASWIEFVRALRLAASVNSFHRDGLWRSRINDSDRAADSVQHASSPATLNELLPDYRQQRTSQNLFPRCRSLNRRMSLMWTMLTKCAAPSTKSFESVVSPLRPTPAGRWLLDSESRHRPNDAPSIKRSFDKHRKLLPVANALPCLLLSKITYSRNMLADNVSWTATVRFEISSPST